MIEILHKERRNSTSWCIACIRQCGQQDDHICGVCQGYVTTYFKCPGCNLITYFTGHDEPDTCKCGIVLPSIRDLKDTVDARVKYHTGQRII